MKDKIDQLMVTDSLWRSVEDEGRHVLDTSDIEIQNVEQLTKVILDQFLMTDTIDKQELLIFIQDWLSSSKGSEVSFKNDSKVRDFIYEMF